MNLEGGKVVLDSYRVIGIKDSDKDKLVSAFEKKESSFTAQEVVEPMIQDQPIVEVVPEIMPEVIPEVSLDDPQVQVSEPVVSLSEEAPALQPVTPEVQENLFVQPQIVDTPAFEQSAPVIPTPVYETPLMSTTDDVQGGFQESSVQNSMPTDLDTPQNFFDRVEQPASTTVLTQSDVESFGNTPSYMSEDPAIIMLDNIRKVVEDKNKMLEEKNNMINALNSKISVLENQVISLEEARKVSEAQRVAAETTLAQAKGAEIPNGGPTLVYQQQPQMQNFNQAA